MRPNIVNIHSHFEWKTGIEIISLEDSGLAPDDLLFSSGIHPANADRESRFLIPGHPNCLAIGECGLDRLIGIPLSVQQTVFEEQIALSEKWELPLVLHCVKAWNEVAQTKKRLKPQQTWIFHGFRKTALLENVLNEGLMISIGTAVLYDQKLQDIISSIPDDRLFLETDSDKQHSIEEVYAKIAALKKISTEQLEMLIFNNFKRTFRHFK